MTTSIGIGLAFVAMLCWGLGDFLIQKSTRKIGDWETLFIICGFGALVLLPFVWRDIPAVISNPASKGFFILLACSVVLFIAALLDFEALKKGKLAVVEPIWSFEIPAAALLAFFILGERISWLQIVLIALLIAGLIAVSFHKVKSSLKRLLMEKGVILALVAAIVMGVANFLVGWGARVTDPLMVNFFLNVFITAVTAVYLIAKGKFSKTIRDAVFYRGVLLPMSILDNTAWVAFAFSMSLAPIAVAVALSESYIIVAVILGLAINKERIQFHQKSGLVLAIFSAIILATITGAS